MKRNDREFRLQCVVVDYLTACAPTLVWTAFPAGELRTAATGARLQRMGLKPGWPDIIAILPGGVLCGFELKAPGGYLGPAQRAVRDLFHVLGARHFTIRSLDDLREALTTLGVPTRETRAAA